MRAPLTIRPDARNTAYGTARYNPAARKPRIVAASFVKKESTAQIEANAPPVSAETSSDCAGRSGRLQFNSVVNWANA